MDLQLKMTLLMVFLQFALTLDGHYCYQKNQSLDERTTHILYYCAICYFSLSLSTRTATKEKSDCQERCTHSEWVES